MDPIILPRISDQKPLVSVVSITYNHEPYIRDCLEGFLMQKTNFPVEVIIHDDASTDHTADIIREYYEKRPDLFHVIIERENQYSQHKPIMAPLHEMVQGKYIALCEGDDYWTDPLKLQKQFDFMESHPDCSLCFHNIVEKEEIDKTTPHMYFSFGYRSASDIFLKWTIPTCSSFFKKEVGDLYNQIRTKDNRFVYGDIVVFLSATRIGKVWGDDQVMAVYRRHANSATTGHPKDFLTRYCNHNLAISEAFPDLKNIADKFICKSIYSALPIKIIKFDVKELLTALRLLKNVKTINAHICGAKEAFAERLHNCFSLF